MNHYDYLAYPPISPTETEAEYVSRYVSGPAYDALDAADRGIASILVVGCGWAEAVSLANYLKPYGGATITGIDSSQLQIDKARKLAKKLDLPNLKLVCAPFEGYDPGCKFDAVIMTGVLHHIRKPMPVLWKANALLNKRGILSGMVYGSRRRFIDLAAKDFRDAGFTNPTNIDHVRSVREALMSREPSDPCRRWYETYSQSDNEVIDTWMHYYARSYSKSQLSTILTKAGFALLKCANDHKMTFLSRKMPP
jgi:SAM-dependent methyltransferase